MAIFSGKPYEEIVGDGYRLRVFGSDIDPDELVWHRDREDRYVEVIEGFGWKLQMDDELPVELFPGSIHFIPEMVYHRLIKGDGTLTVKIRRNK